MLAPNVFTKTFYPTKKKKNKHIYHAMAQFLIKQICHADAVNKHTFRIPGSGFESSEAYRRCLVNCFAVKKERVNTRLGCRLSARRRLVTSHLCAAHKFVSDASNFVAACPASSVYDLCLSNGGFTKLFRL